MSTVKNFPTKAKSYAPSAPCYHSHPALEIAEGIYIYGGNCSTPAVEDADVYVALDSSGSSNKRQYPWHKETAFTFRITDMSVPSNLDEFKQLIKYLSAQLKKGKKVHVGCIGGHGRTGLVFAALRKQMAKDEDATQYVRDNYCKKAVESEKQIDWLYKHFKITKVKPVKKFGSHQSAGQKSFWEKWPDHGSQVKDFHDMNSKTVTGRVALNEPLTLQPYPDAGDIWGKYTDDDDTEII